MFEPPVTVWLEASNGYRSGSRPTVTSPTAALNSPLAETPRHELARVGRARWMTDSPSAVQSPGDSAAAA